MKCPVCKSNNLQVTGTKSDFKTITQRYRICLDCGAQFQTTEQLLDGTVQENIYNELFEKDLKLFEENACEHCPHRGKLKRKIED